MEAQLTNSAKLEDSLAKTSEAIATTLQGMQGFVTQMATLMHNSYAPSMVPQAMAPPGMALPSMVAQAMTPPGATPPSVGPQAMAPAGMMPWMAVQGIANQLQPTQQSTPPTITQPSPTVTRPPAATITQPPTTGSSTVTPPPPGLLMRPQSIDHDDSL